MARKLTNKQKGFVKDVANGVVPTKAALMNYETIDYSTAGNIASENLNLPKIQEALNKLGFNSDNAKSVVAEILIAGENDSVKLKAAEIVFKVHGDYAPEKHEIDTTERPSKELIELATMASVLLKQKKM